MKRLINIEYASSHAAYWMYYGVIASFSSAFLLGRGYTNSEIGIILAVASVLSVIIQPFMADIADRSKRFDTFGVLKLSVIFMLVVGAGLFVFTAKSPALWALYVVISALLMALQPLLNVLPQVYEGAGQSVNFGICRSGGSFGYAILMAFLGTLVADFGEGVLPIAAEILIGVLLLVIFLMNGSYRKSLAAGETVAAGTLVHEDAGDGEDINLLEFMRRNRLFVVLNLAIILLFFQNYIANNFMLQIVQDVGGDAEDLGRIFSVMAFLEIPTLFFYDKIRRHFTCQTLLKVAAISFVVKFVIIYVAQSVVLIYVAHFLQLTSFALFLPAMVDFTGSIMTKGEAAKGQALYTACVTVSSIFASLLGGIMIDMAGAKFMVLVATIVAVLGAAAVIMLVGKIKVRE